MASLINQEETALFPNAFPYDTIEKMEEKGNEKDFRGEGVTGI